MSKFQERLFIRITPTDRERFRAAAEAEAKSVSAFVRDAATLRALELASSEK